MIKPTKLGQVRLELLHKLFTVEDLAREPEVVNPPAILIGRHDDLDPCRSDLPNFGVGIEP
jgi:hypothetical protein